MQLARRYTYNNKCTIKLGLPVDSLSSLSLIIILSFKMENQTKKTMFNYFNKLASKTPVVDENPRKTAPVFNEQHVKEFQDRVEAFDSELLNVRETSNYITSIKSGEYKPYRIGKKCRGPLRARLLQFGEDVRPPYFGTWQKTTRLVSGRKIHGRDDNIFDYDNDSEAEWDIGGPGESLKGDDSEDEEEMDDYEIDMKTFVPHGYVSDDEIECNSDNEEKPETENKNIDDDCEPSNDSDSDIKIISTTGIPKHNRQEQQPVAQHVTKQTPKMDIKPIILGLTYEDNPTISESKMQFLKTFEGVSCN